MPTSPHADLEAGAARAETSYGTIPAPASAASTDQTHSQGTLLEPVSDSVGARRWLPSKKRMIALGSLTAFGLTMYYPIRAMWTGELICREVQLPDGTLIMVCERSDTPGGPEETSFMTLDPFGGAVSDGAGVTIEIQKTERENNDPEEWVKWCAEQGWTEEQGKTCLTQLEST